MPVFQHLEILPDDPILGLGQLYARDPRTNKMDLGVGIYKDPAGHTPVMAAVKLAEQWLVDNEASKAYTSPAGVAGFEAAITPLLLGEAASAALGERYAAIQTPGGTGSLRLMAEFLRRTGQVRQVLIGVPTWPIHVPIFERAGLAVKTYAHLDANAEFNLPALLAAMESLDEGSAVLLHACCHNPTGIDPERGQWQAILEVVQRKHLLPLFDMAYQGFGDGLEEDAWAMRLFCATVPEVLISASCSKNFGLYRERTGVLLAACSDARSLAAVKSQVLDSARCLWSMPPSHGAAVVTRILSDANLRSLWLSELNAMRQRIVDLRQGLCSALQAVDAYGPFQTLGQQKGMFSNLGRDAQFVLQLREQSGVYLVGQGRINVSGLAPERQGELASALKAGL
ncbi:aromatic amino acid transaminase [Pseudomonas sp. nanlin1]|uniref:amino acid aminotransferase n=1 Tax=Pseudomonas sp. nanlin1 TaxID=3040605 RepID=UPI00388E7B63